MDNLIREFEALRDRPQLTNDQVVGALLATTVRFREILNERMVGIQAIATAVAMQPEIDVMRFHDDYLNILKAHFESMRRVPSELRDVASSIKLIAAEGH